MYKIKLGKVEAEIPDKDVTTYNKLGFTSISRNPEKSSWESASKRKRVFGNKKNLQKRLKKLNRSVSDSSNDIMNRLYHLKKI